MNELFSLDALPASNYRHSSPLIVDCFAGGGGASIGIEMALGRSPDIAINHDADAIRMHQTNHPATRHFQANIFDVHPRGACEGREVGLLWASPDCRHHSRAAGGRPKSAGVRMLADVVIRWANQVQPGYIFLENVPEFEDWGPLDEHGMPEKARKGERFKAWVHAIEKNGYKVEWMPLVAADYGSPTIRKRLFLVARHRKTGRGGVHWPSRTHYNPKVETVAGLDPWIAAYTIINWALPCPSVFWGPEEAQAWYEITGERIKRPLAEKTMERLFKGCVKYQDDPFIVTANHQGDSFRGQGLDDPFKTITSARDAHGLVTSFIDRQFGRSSGDELDTPIATVKAGGSGGSALVSAFLTEHANGTHQRVFDPSDPLRTQCSNIKGGHFALVQAWIAKHYGGVVGTEVDKPLPTITGRGTQNQLVQSHLSTLRGTSTAGRSGTDPVPALTAGGNHVAEVRAFFMRYHSTGGQHADPSDPLTSVTSKDRLGLVKVEGIDYQMTDIGMRMLTPPELFAAQGFPANYQITEDYAGRPFTKTAQVKLCGNSVCPQVAKALVTANCEHLIEAKAAE